MHVNWFSLFWPGFSISSGPCHLESERRNAVDTNPDQAGRRRAETFEGSQHQFSTNESSALQDSRAALQPQRSLANAPLGFVERGMASSTLGLNETGAGARVETWFPSATRTWNLPDLTPVRPQYAAAAEHMDYARVGYSYPSLLTNVGGHHVPGPQRQQVDDVALAAITPYTGIPQSLDTFSLYHAAGGIAGTLTPQYGGSMPHSQILRDSNVRRMPRPFPQPPPPSFMAPMAASGMPYIYTSPRRISHAEPFLASPPVRPTNIASLNSQQMPAAVVEARPPARPRASSSILCPVCNGHKNFVESIGAYENTRRGSSSAVCMQRARLPSDFYQAS